MPAMEPKPEEQAANAQQAYETVKMLWDDQVSQAESLKDRRKLYATLVAATSAVGVIRIAWSVRPEEVSPFPGPVSEWLVRVLVFLGVALVATACFHLFREGSKDPARAPGAERRVTVYADERKSDSSTAPDQPSSPSSRALAATEIDETTMEQWLSIPTHEVWMQRAMTLSRAYERLVDQNNRVRDRLGKGLSLLGLGYLCIVLAILTYTLTSGPGGRAHGNDPKQSEPADTRREGR